MALYWVKGPNVPTDHIRLTRTEAVNFQLGLLHNLAPLKYSFFVKYGPEVSCSIGVTTSSWIAMIYRKCVNIGNYNRMSTSIPLIIAPAFIHLALNRRFVRNDIIVNKWACPYCYHMRSVIFQVFFGAILPIITAPVVAFANARRLGIPGVPALNNKSEIWEFYIKKTNPIKRLLLFVTVAQCIIGAGIAHAEASENNYFNLNIDKFITDYENNRKKQ